MKLEKKCNFIFLRFMLFVLLGFACTPKGGEIEPVRRPAATATPVVSPSNAAVPLGTPSSPQQSGVCKEGSEPATPELRACCRERQWGKACDGACWAEGAGEKLRRMCNATKAPISDCSNSPAQTDVKEWCNFHYNRRYCGISDAQWRQTCASAPNK